MATYQDELNTKVFLRETDFGLDPGRRWAVFPHESIRATYYDDKDEGYAAVLLAYLLETRRYRHYLEKGNPNFAPPSAFAELVDGWRPCQIARAYTALWRLSSSFVKVTNFVLEAVVAHVSGHELVVDRCPGYKDTVAMFSLSRREGSNFVEFASVQVLPVPANATGEFTLEGNVLIWGDYQVDLADPRWKANILARQA